MDTDVLNKVLVTVLALVIGYMFFRMDKARRNSEDLATAQDSLINRLAQDNIDLSDLLQEQHTLRVDEVIRHRQTRCNLNDVTAALHRETQRRLRVERNLHDAVQIMHNHEQSLELVINELSTAAEEAAIEHARTVLGGTIEDFN